MSRTRLYAALVALLLASTVASACADAGSTTAPDFSDGCTETQGSTTRC